MREYLLVIFYLTCLLGCEKDEEKYSRLPDGVYVGTFQRELVWSDNDSANIIMTFSSNTWLGSSDKTKYPALCKGTYSIAGDIIIFENECAWTTEFDWSLILTGEYVLKTKRNDIEFYRDYRSSTSDTYVDRYKIKRQVK